MQCPTAPASGANLSLNQLPLILAKEITSKSISIVTREGRNGQHPKLIRGLQCKNGHHFIPLTTMIQKAIEGIYHFGQQLLCPDLQLLRSSFVCDLQKLVSKERQAFQNLNPARI